MSARIRPHAHQLQPDPHGGAFQATSAQQRPAPARQFGIPALANAHLARPRARRPSEHLAPLSQRKRPNSPRTSTDESEFETRAKGAASSSDTDEDRINRRFISKRRRRGCCQWLVEFCNGVSRSLRRQWLECTTRCQRRFRKTDGQHVMACLLALFAIGWVYYSTNKDFRMKIGHLFPITKTSWVRSSPTRQPSLGPSHGPSSRPIQDVEELSDALRQIQDLDQLSTFRQQLEEGTLFNAQLEKMKQQLQEEMKLYYRTTHSGDYEGNVHSAGLDEQQQQLLRLQESVDALSRAVSDTMDPQDHYASLQEQLSRQEHKMAQLQDNLNTKFDSIEHKISNISPSGKKVKPGAVDLRVIESRIQELEQSKQHLKETLSKLEASRKSIVDSASPEGVVSEEFIESIVEKKLSENYPSPSRQIDWISSVVDHSAEHLEGNTADRINSWFVGTGKDPELVLQGSDKIGDCYPLRVDKTTAGWMEFKLLQHIVPRQVMLHHVDHRETPLYSTSPEKFWVLGSNNRRNWHKLGIFSYEGQSLPRQMFKLSNINNRSYEYIRLEIKSNRGAKYTCLYQFSVHGELPKRIEFVETSDNQPSI